MADWQPTDTPLAVLESLFSVVGEFSVCSFRPNTIRRTVGSFKQIHSFICQNILILLGIVEVY